MKQDVVTIRIGDYYVLTVPAAWARTDEQMAAIADLDPSTRGMFDFGRGVRKHVESRVVEAKALPAPEHLKSEISEKGGQ